MEFKEIKAAIKCCGNCKRKNTKGKSWCNRCGYDKRYDCQPKWYKNPKITLIKELIIKKDKQTIKLSFEELRELPIGIKSNIFNGFIEETGE